RLGLPRSESKFPGAVAEDQGVDLGSAGVLAGWTGGRLARPRRDAGAPNLLPSSPVPEKVRRYTLKAPVKAQKVYRVRYEDELNPEQLEVVMAGEGPMLVIAGAGSGKTRALTYRVSRLIEAGVDPSEILIVTSTA